MCVTLKHLNEFLVTLNLTLLYNVCISRICTAERQLNVDYFGILAKSKRFLQIQLKYYYAPHFKAGFPLGEFVRANRERAT